ncbi:MAG: helix-turn-helix transcriptional regulator [Clostridia bacterium]|nr:helix-turn-helix transcriptional regulator [Clostridia bacterium]
MEKYIGIWNDSEERGRLPLSPVAFGDGAKTVVPTEAHLLLSVKEGSAKLSYREGDEELYDGTMLFIRRGAEVEFFEKSADFECEFVLFEAEEAFLEHLELPDVAIGEVGEGVGITSVVKMSAYALEYYHDRLRICAAVYSALAKIARDGMISRLERFDTLSERLSPAMLQIEQRYMEQLTVRILAHSCSMSESVFTRSFKRVYGCTPVQYLIKVRLEAAKELLATTDRSFDDIAKSCGFKNAKYFGDILKKNEHVTPRELRAMYQGMTQVKFF